MKYIKVPFELHSAGGETLDAIKFIPEKPIAIVQLIHGMSEHIHRYEEFAGFLAEHGYVVVGHTHAGHGENAKLLGYFADNGGWNILLTDIDSIRKSISGEYPMLPYYIFGHSMGSLLLRNYLQEHSEGLAGVVICGTAKQPISKIKFAKLLTKLLLLLGYGKKPAKLLNAMNFGVYNKGISNPRTLFDWLSRDNKQVDKYIEDEFCGFMFTNLGYYDLFSGLENIETPKKNQNINKELPIYIISGGADPVGDNGKAVRRIYDEYKGLGIKNLDICVYKDARHEILNEINKEEVYKDVLSFLERTN